MDLGTAQSVLLSGIVLGSLYALMATGLSLIWTTLGIFNFAHGVFMTLGAFIAWQIGADLGWGVNGGGIMLHAERPDGPVAAAQKCANHGPLSVATRGGGCTAWSSMRRFDWRLSTRV